MVVIRLARGGAKKRPFFNVVVADRRDARDGRFIERLGFYDPKAPAGRESLRISLDRLTHWQGKGAKLSDTVARLVRQFGAAQVAQPASELTRARSTLIRPSAGVGTLDGVGMVVMGRVAGRVRVKGWIKVQPFTELTDGLLDYRTWWLAQDGGWGESRVEEGAVHGRSLIAKLEGCDDRDAASRLTAGKWRCHAPSCRRIVRVSTTGVS